MPQRGAGRPRLVFVSPQFLFPNDAGGKIRSTNILRGMKGGTFALSLLSPASAEQVRRWKAELDGVCDEFIAWQPARRRPGWRRAIDLFDALPVNVRSDLTPPALQAVRAVAARSDVDLIVFDFVHSAVLRPAGLRCPSVCFTHNVEAEIFARHASQARDPLRRAIWSAQHRKMLRFEAEALRSFSSVVAVSKRDARFFAESYRVAEVHDIPTGVDLDFFAWRAPPEVDASHPPTVVFTGSMDWAANIDGVRFFLREVWPKVLAVRPEARFTVVGRSPPDALRAAAQAVSGVQFTGFVDDVRPHVHGAHAFVIPLLVGGGTRIKAFEAMAMGCPVVSTTIGTEGLEATAERHFLQRDGAAAMAAALLDLLADATLRERLSTAARRLVVDRFGHQVAASAFERICERAWQHAAAR